MRALVTYGDMLPSFDRADESYSILNIPYYFPAHSESEICVPLSSCKKAMLQLSSVLKDENVPLNYITEVLVLAHHIHSVYLYKYNHQLLIPCGNNWVKWQFNSSSTCSIYIVYMMNYISSYGDHHSPFFKNSHGYSSLLQ